MSTKEAIPSALPYLTYPATPFGRQRLKIKVWGVIDNGIDFNVKQRDGEFMLLFSWSDRHHLLTKEELEKWPKK